MKTSGDNSKEIRAAPRYITFGAPAVRPPCSYSPYSSSLDPSACPSPVLTLSSALLRISHRDRICVFLRRILPWLSQPRGWCFRNNNARVSNVTFLATLRSPPRWILFLPFSFLVINLCPLDRRGCCYRIRVATCQHILVVIDEKLCLLRKW